MACQHVLFFLIFFHDIPLPEPWHKHSNEESVTHPCILCISLQSVKKNLLLDLCGEITVPRISLMFAPNYKTCDFPAHLVAVQQPHNTIKIGGHKTEIDLEAKLPLQLQKGVIIPLWISALISNYTKSNIMNLHKRNVKSLVEKLVLV